MKIKDIIQILPASIEWMVLFNVEVFRNIAGDDTFKEMYFINPSSNLNEYDYIILSSIGRFLTKKDVNELINGETLKKESFSSKSKLIDEYEEYLSHLNYNNAHCLALANIGQYGKVALYIDIIENVACAKAIFDEQPSNNFYEYLQAIGVTYIGGNHSDKKFVAQYSNKIPIHIHSGILNHFTRTDNCNIFFFNHGNIDNLLFEGLFAAYEKRKDWMLKKLEEKLIALTKKSLKEKVAMDWLPPVGTLVFPFGDVVPLGFLKLALNQTNNIDLINKVAMKLYAEQIRGLWPFESKDLETSVDSSLVLLGIKDKEAILRISRFWNGIFGYLPQISSENPLEGQMQYVDEKKHWCQVDFATTALIFALQKENNLPTMIETENYILNSYEKRSGLYFANPYMVDWIYAKAIKHIANTKSLKQRLINDILSSINNDYSVGKFDKVLSSAFAILALNELGYTGHAIPSLQLYIINNLESEEGTCIPFYSSLILSKEQVFEVRSVEVNQQKLQISFHRDTYNSILFSISFLALNITTVANFTIKESIDKYINESATDLYNHQDLLDYLKTHALVPYVF